MGGNHHRGLDLESFDGGKGRLGIEAPEDHRRCPSGQQAHPAERTGVIHRPDHEVGPEVGHPVLGQTFQVFGHGVAAGKHGRR